MENNKTFKFIDLFAGIGGFHCSIKSLGGKCVFVSEIDSLCKKTYALNFPETTKYINGDIKEVDPAKIKKFDMICAGFPCQSFSKAGKRKGFDDETRGDLFSKTLDILKAHPECEFVLLENVKNLADNKNFWDVIVKSFSKLNYYITKEPIVLSPLDFGIPQNRDRVFILGIKKDIAIKPIVDKKEITIDDLGLKEHFKILSKKAAFEILDDEADKSLILSKDEEEVLQAWDEFKQTIYKKKIFAPIWMQYFGEKYKSDTCFFKSVGYDKMPEWKQKFVERNRNFYIENKEKIDLWEKKWKMNSRNKIYRKFEWNCLEDCKSIKDGITQLRHSGVRVKRPDYFPALVAINNTPIIWDEKLQHFRKLSVRETARLQSFPEKYNFIGPVSQQYKQLGNSVNVKIVKIVAKCLLSLKRKD